MEDTLRQQNVITFYEAVFTGRHKWIRLIYLESDSDSKVLSSEPGVTSDWF